MELLSRSVNEGTTVTLCISHKDLDGMDMFLPTDLRRTPSQNSKLLGRDWTPLKDPALGNGEKEGKFLGIFIAGTTVPLHAGDELERDWSFPEAITIH